MRILLLLTLNGLTLGLPFNNICDGQVNGVFATSNCSANYIQCFNGKLTNKTCPIGLVFNSDRNQCDFATNVDNCLAQMSCQGRMDGGFAIGCSSSYFVCSNGIIHQRKCQHGLYYDVYREMCDHKFRVRACGGHPEVEREPVIHSPFLVPTYAPYALKANANVNGHARIPANIALSCQGKANGAYPIGKCVQQYATCSDGTWKLVECEAGKVFKEGTCLPRISVSECLPSSIRTPEANSKSFNCSNYQDGYYGSKCNSQFFSCQGGVLRAMRCPSSLVFDEAKGYCDYPGNDCTSEITSDPSRPLRQAVHSQTASAPAVGFLKKGCEGKKNGFYSNGCSNEFVSCVNGVATVMNCRPQLVFNNRSRSCVYPESCSRDGEVNPRPIAHVYTTAQTMRTPSTSVECEGKKEGYYAKECSSEFVYCNGEGVATYMKCPSSLVFNQEKGYCDYPNDCSATTMRQFHSVERLTRSTGELNIECSTLPNGEYGSQCSPTFTLCSNGISYSMKCPENLVFDAKNSRCTHIHKCDRQDASQKASIGFFGTKLSENECINKPDGLHSLGCVSVFLQCVEGVAYNLSCPTGLVFVGEIGACDSPSTCSQHSRHKEANAPTSYAAVIGSSTIDSKNETKCDVDGYFSRKCSSEYFNCVGGKKFVGKCLNGMVFNVEKAYCDYPESCLRGELDSNPAAQSVPTTIIDRGFSCEHRSNGVVADHDCQRRFTTCLDSTAFVTTCPHGLVYSIMLEMCDHPESCKVNSAPETLSSKSNTSVPPSSTNSPNSSPISSLASVQFQNTAIGAQLCSSRVDGPLSSTDCRPSFSFCAHGSLYSINCANGLLYSFSSRRCELPSVCDVHLKDVALNGMPTTEAATSIGLPPSTFLHILSKMSQEVECNVSMALGRCSSEFQRCKDGKLISAQCPEHSLFDNNLLLCIYDLQECHTTPLGTERSSEKTTRPDFSAASTVYTVPVVPTYEPHSLTSKTYAQSYNTFGDIKDNSFPLIYTEYEPSDVYDMFTGGKINRGPIKFEERSVLVDNRRQKVFDVFDGYAIPWLRDGYNRVFVPNQHKRHRQYRYSSSQSEEMDDVSSPFDYEGANEDIMELDAHTEFINDGILTNSNDTESKGQNIEGSGQDIHSRKRRNSDDNKTRGFSMCNHSNSPGIVAVGFCSQDFVVCKSVGVAVFGACPVGDLFDNISKKCISSTSCGQSPSMLNLKRQALSHSTESIIEQVCIEGSDFGVECSGNFMKCVHGHFYPMKCPEGLVFDRLNHQCNYPHDVTACKAESARSKPQMKDFTDRTATGDPIVPIISKAVVGMNDTTEMITTDDPIVPIASKALIDMEDHMNMTANSDVVVSTESNAVVDMKDTTEMIATDDLIVPIDSKVLVDMKEPINMTVSSDVVFSTDTKPIVETKDPTVMTATSDPIAPIANKAVVSMGDATDRTASGDPVFPVITKALVDMKDPTNMTTTSDPLVPIANKAVVDHSEVKTFGTGREQPTELVNAVSAVTTELLKNSCPTHPQAVTRCSSKFLICLRGIPNELQCSSPLVFNPVTMRCDPREVVPECHNFEEQTTTQSNAAPSCVYDEKRPLFALNFCGRIYGACSEQGFLVHKECNISFLFDSHLNTCVPAEQCGREGLRDLLSKMMPRAQSVEVQAGEHSFTSEKKEDDRCRNTTEEGMKPLGRCRSSHIRCLDGKAEVNMGDSINMIATSDPIVPIVNKAVVDHSEVKTFGTGREQPAELVNPVSAVATELLNNSCPTDPQAVTRCSSKFLICLRGIPNELQCSSPLVFNPVTMRCDPREVVPECHNFEEQTTTQSNAVSGFASNF